MSERLPISPGWLVQPQTAQERRDRAVMSDRLNRIGPAISRTLDQTDDWRLLDSLTPSQLNCVLAMATHGRQQEAAHALYMQYQTFKTTLWEARRRLGHTGSREASCSSHRLIALAVRYCLETQRHDAEATP